MDLESDINEMWDILKIATEESPKFLNGILIPSQYLPKFHYLLKSFIGMAKDSKKYFRQIMEMTHHSQKATNDFVIELCKSIKEGTIQFNTKKEKR